MKISSPRWIMVAIRKTLAWKGRSQRAEAWWYLLLPVLLTIATIVVEMGIYADEDVPTAVSLAELTAIGVAMVPAIGCAIRRLHDLGRSGWWYLMLALPIAAFAIAPTVDDETFSDAEAIALVLALSGAATLLYWFLQRGTIGENRYGPDPLMAD